MAVSFIRKMTMHGSGVKNVRKYVDWKAESGWRELLVWGNQIGCWKLKGRSGKLRMSRIADRY